jgi:hypothetical protein
MHAYNPLQAPDPATWLALPEQDRIDLVATCQKQAGVKTPLPDIHTFMHATIENQIASPESPQAKRAMDRLLADGLDRHEAVHAIGSVLARFMPALLTDKDKKPFDAQAYYGALDHLTKESWYREYR